MAEHEEEKGFVVKDRRRFTEETVEREEGREPRERAESASGQPRGEEAEMFSGEEDRDFGPLPEVTLSTFVFSLSSSALVHLGEIPEPDTNRTTMDLAIAKQIIDTLGMLQEKTKGNLDGDEDNLLRSVLYDLRMRYVQKAGK